MAQSYETYTAIGGEDTYAVPFPYLRRTHVVVYKNDVVVSDYSWLSATQIQFTADVNAGTVIKFQRVTPETPLFVSSDGAILTDSALRTLGLQTIYLTQETNDRSNITLTAAEAAADLIDDTSANAAAAAVSAAAAAAAYISFSARYLGPKAAAPTVDNAGAALTAGALYYDTVTSKLREWSGVAWADVASGMTQGAADARYLRLGVFTNTILGTNNFFGAVTVPTASPNDNSFNAASTAYVDAKWTTGDIKVSWKTTADTGWIMVNDGTIGDATSGATTRANADTSALFTLIWTNFAQAQAAVSGGSRGASAAADFAAHKTIALPKALGRVLGFSGTGSGLTARTHGVTAGAETGTPPLAAHVHSYSDTTITSVVTSPADANGGGSTIAAVTAVTPGSTSPSTGSTGPGGTMSLMQPTSFWNAMVKL